MAKIDIQHAYRNVPVHPDDRHLLAMRWKDEILIDKVLPFGLRSAPFIFTDAGSLNKGGYLDDYITIECQHNLDIIQQACDDPLERAGLYHFLGSTQERVSSAYQKTNWGASASH